MSPKSGFALLFPRAVEALNILWMAFLTQGSEKGVRQEVDEMTLLDLVKNVSIDGPFSKVRTL